MTVEGQTKQNYRKNALVGQQGLVSRLSHFPAASAVSPHRLRSLDSVSPSRFCFSPLAFFVFVFSLLIFQPLYRLFLERPRKARALEAKRKVEAEAIEAEAKAAARATQEEGEEEEAAAAAVALGDDESDASDDSDIVGCDGESLEETDEDVEGGDGGGKRTGALKTAVAVRGAGIGVWLSCALFFLVSAGCVCERESVIPCLSAFYFVLKWWRVGDVRHFYLSRKSFFLCFLVFFSVYFLYFGFMRGMLYSSPLQGRATHQISTSPDQHA